MLKSTPGEPPIKARFIIVACLLLALGLIAVGCGSGGSSSSSTEAESTAESTTTDTSTSSGSGTDASYKIGMLLPQNVAERFEKFDRPYFEESLSELCPNCEVLYENAQEDGNAEKQQQQAESVLANGAEVLVVTADNPEAAATIAELAKAKGVPVIADTRPILNSDNVKAYITSDSPQLCTLQAEAMKKRLKELKKPNGPVLMINGPANEPEPVLCRETVKKIFDEAGVKVLDSYDTPAWDPTKDQTQMEQWMLKYDENEVAGIYCVWSECAGAVAAAMKTRGWDPVTHPTTGLDTEPSELQRILTGEQFMTVLQRIDLISKYTAQVALELAEGKPLNKTVLNTTRDLGSAKGIPTRYIPGVEITKPDIKNYLIKNGWYTASEICTGEYKKVCEEAGIE